MIRGLTVAPARLWFSCELAGKGTHTRLVTAIVYAISLEDSLSLLTKLLITGNRPEQILQPYVISPTGKF